MKRIINVKLDEIKKYKGKIQIMDIEVEDVSKRVSNEVSSVIADMLSKKIVDNCDTFKTIVNSSEISKNEVDYD